MKVSRTHHVTKKGTIRRNPEKMDDGDVPVGAVSLVMDGLREGMTPETAVQKLMKEAKYPRSKAERVVRVALRWWRGTS